MANFKQDIYVLGQSQTGSVSSVGEEIRLDLSLLPQPLIQTGTVSGTVTYNGSPLPNAVVKVLDSNYNPVIHAVSQTDGTYSIANHPAGSGYHIYCSATGKLLNEGITYTISAGDSLTRDFTMTDDPNASLSIIAGDLLDSATSQPISGAVVSLYKYDTTTQGEVLAAITYTNQYGQFVFRELGIAQYTIRIAALGYNSVTTTIQITQAGQIAPVDLNMNQNATTSRGTVSGVITDNNNHVIANADVVLYRVETDGRLTAMAFTKTDANGVYLFINVDQGDYKVKSTQADQ